MAKTTFLSYSRSDAAFATRLSNDLRSRGHQIWQDTVNITGGLRWDSAIEEAIAKADTVLVVLSPQSVASENVKDEYSFAIEKGKQVVPVMHAFCEIPFRLRRLQYIDFTSDYADGLDKLEAILGHGATGLPAKPHTATAPLHEALARSNKNQSLSNTGENNPARSLTANLARNKPVLVAAATILMVSGYFLAKRLSGNTPKVAAIAVDSTALGEKLSGQHATLYYTNNLTKEAAEDVVFYLDSLGAADSKLLASWPVFQLYKQDTTYWFCYALAESNQVTDQLKESMKTVGGGLMNRLQVSSFVVWAGRIVENKEFDHIALSNPSTENTAQSADSSSTTEEAAAH